MGRTTEDYQKDLASGGQLHLECTRFHEKHEPTRSVPIAESSTITVGTSSKRSKKIIDALERVTNTFPKANDISSWQMKSPPMILAKIENYHMQQDHRQRIEANLSTVPHRWTDTTTHGVDDMESQLLEIEQFLEKDTRKSWMAD